MLIIMRKCNKCGEYFVADLFQLTCDFCGIRGEPMAWISVPKPEEPRDPFPKKPYSKKPRA